MSLTTKPRKSAASATLTDVAREHGVSASMKAEVMNFPELTDEQLATAKPFVDVFPGLASTIKRRGKQKEPTKVPVSIRLDRAVVEHFKSGGPGWQARMSDVLRKSVAD